MKIVVQLAGFHAARLGARLASLVARTSTRRRRPPQLLDIDGGMGTEPTARLAGRRPLTPKSLQPQPRRG